MKRIPLFVAAVLVCLPGAAPRAAEPESPASERSTSRPADSPAKPGPPQIRFVDVTHAAGVDFVHRSGAKGDKLLPETMGGGVALFDYDGDRDADLLLVQSDAKGSSVAALYRNETQSGKPIRFTDVTRDVGLAGVDTDGFYGMGAAVADIDADGDVDVFLTGVGRDRLLRNDLVDGQRRFIDVTAESGVGGDIAWSTGAAFFDADVDGDLDLMVVRYVEWSQDLEKKLVFRLDGVGRAYGPPQEYAGTLPALFLNRGDGTFEDVTKGSGLEVVDAAIQEKDRPQAKSLAVLPVDADLDGRMDVLVANDTVRNYFFRNLGSSETAPVRFEEVGEFYGLAYDTDGKVTGAMGIDAGYYRNDGNLGFLVGNYAAETSSILRAQDDPGFFVDEAMKEGLGAATRARLTFGAFFFDADLDGRLDVLHANGHVEPDIAKIDETQQYRQPGQLFWNQGDGFVLLGDAAVGDLAKEIPGRGAAYADLDADGDLDVVLTQIDGPPLILRNDQAGGAHWLRVRLMPPHLAIGARVELNVGGAGSSQTQRRQVMPTRSYLSQVEPVATFGLGGAEKVESLKVIWPDGVEQAVAVDGVDAEVAVQRSAAVSPR